MWSLLTFALLVFLTDSSTNSLRGSAFQSSCRSPGTPCHTCSFCPHVWAGASPSRSLMGAPFAEWFLFQPSTFAWMWCGRWDTWMVVCPTETEPHVLLDAYGTGLVHHLFFWTRTMIAPRMVGLVSSRPQLWGWFITQKFTKTNWSGRLGVLGAGGLGRPAYPIRARALCDPMPVAGLMYERCLGLRQNSDLPTGLNRT